MQPILESDIIRLYSQACSDLHVLRLMNLYGFIHLAGNMHYSDVLFGRDACVIAYDNKEAAKALPGTPSFDRRFASSPVPTLLELADHQGIYYDFYNEEFPGRILHEKVTGQHHWAYNKSKREPGRNIYSSEDATFRTLDLAVTSWDEVLWYDRYFPEYRAPQRIAQMVANILRYAKDRQDEYRSVHIFNRRRNPEDYDKIHGVIYDVMQNLANHGWRDSGNSEAVKHGYRVPDDPTFDPRSPIFSIEAYRAAKQREILLRDPKVAVAYLEVQALLWHAIESFDDRILAQWGNDNKERGPILQLVQHFKDDNPALKQAMLEDFATSEGYYAYAIGRDGTTYDADTSDPACLIGLGVLDPRDTEDLEKIRLIHHKLTDVDTFLTPFGLRTMSSKEDAFDPYSYHNGPVWLHNNVMVIDALFEAGYKEDAKIILNALLRGILELEKASGRLVLYELFCVPKGPNYRNGMRPYREPETGRDACTIQGWAASGLRRILLKVYGDVVDKYLSLTGGADEFEGIVA